MKGLLVLLATVAVAQSRHIPSRTSDEVRCSGCRASRGFVRVRLWSVCWWIQYSISRSHREVGWYIPSYNSNCYDRWKWMVCLWYDTPWCKIQNRCRLSTVLIQTHSDIEWIDRQYICTIWRIVIRSIRTKLCTLWLDTKTVNKGLQFYLYLCTAYNIW